MADIALQEQLIAKIKTLSDGQLKSLLRKIEEMESTGLPPDCDPDKDPAIGFIEGPTDLSERYKEILKEDIDLRSGWTGKDKLP